MKPTLVNENDNFSHIIYAQVQPTASQKKNTLRVLDPGGVHRCDYYYALSEISAYTAAVFVLCHLHKLQDTHCMRLDIFEKDVNKNVNNIYSKNKVLV